jgi:hypothetical protein
MNSKHLLPALIPMTALVMLMAFSGCDLFNNKPEIDLEKKMDDAVAWANAPWVPIYINEGGLGTANPRGTLNTTVKKGYSFTLNFAPNSEYPFKGWQARLAGETGLLASWQPLGGGGRNRTGKRPL